MKSRILLTVSLLNVGYINPQQLEMKGEAPKSSKQVEREAAQRQRFLQEQARKKKEEEKRLKAEQEAAERKRLEDQKNLNSYLQKIDRRAPNIIGTEDEATIKTIFVPAAENLAAARKSIVDLSVTFDSRLLKFASTVDREKYAFIEKDQAQLTRGKTGVDILPLHDFSFFVSDEIKDSLRSDSFPAAASPDDIMAWHAGRRRLVEALVRSRLEDYYFWLKDQRKFKPFWRGATLGIGVLGSVSANQNTIRSTFPRQYLYIDANLLFWSFMRIGPYLAADVRKGSVDKFGGSLEFVLGSPRAALLLGSRFGRAKHEFTSIEYNAITPMIGFELALGLPIALFARYEAEFLQLSPNRFDRNDQINLGVRLRHYNETYFAGRDQARSQVSGSPLFDLFAAVSLRLGAHFAHAPFEHATARAPRNFGIYDIGLQAGRSTGVVMGYAFASESLEGRLQRHMPHIGVVSPRFALMDFGIMTGPVWERNGSQESVLGAAWLQMRWTALYFGATFGYVLHFGAGDDSIRRNMYTAGFHIMF